MISSNHANVSLKRNKLLWTFIIGGLIFGLLFASYYHPKEGIVDINGDILRRRVGGGMSTITYNTSGPIISSFEKGCYTTGEFGIGTGYYCLVLYYRGGPGMVELRIPSYLLTDHYQWIRTIEKSGSPIPFQRISEDTNYRTFRVQVPAEDKYDYEIILNGGDNFPLWVDYIGNAALFSGIGFVVVAFSWMFFYFLIQYLKKKLQSNT